MTLQKSCENIEARICFKKKIAFNRFQISCQKYGSKGRDAREARNLYTRVHWKTPAVETFY